VEASDVPGDDVEISPELSFAFTGVCCFVGFGFVWGVVLADPSATSRIESKTWLDPTSSWTLVRSFSAFASRSLGSLWIRSWTLRIAMNMDCIWPSMAVSVAVVGSVCVVVCVVCTGVVCCCMCGFVCNVGKSVSDSSAGAIWEGRCVVICGGDLVFNAHGAGAVTAAWGGLWRG